MARCFRVVTLDVWGLRGEWADRRHVLTGGLHELHLDLVAFVEAIKTETFTPRNPLVYDWDWPFRRLDYVLVRCGGHGGPTLAVARCERIFDEPVEGVWAATTSASPPTWSFLSRRSRTRA